MVYPIGTQDISNLPLFFIIGRPRSGTTLLRLLFEAHPHVLIPPECPYIIQLYKKYGSATKWDVGRIRDFTEDICRQRYFDKWNVGKEELFNHLKEGEGENTFQEMVKRVNLAYRSVYEKSGILLLGDKNPAYALFGQRLLKLFPDAKIVHLVRDYRDNYLSLTDVNFEVPVVPLVVYRWKFALQRMWKLKARYPGSVFSLRYEDLAGNPEEKMKELCAFLGIQYDPVVMGFYKKKPEVEVLYNGSEELMMVHKSLLHPISRSRIDTWKSRMSRRDIRVADLVAGRSADKTGYARQFRSFDPFLYLWILPTLAYAWIMYRLILLGDHLPYRMRGWLLRRLGIFLKIYWKIHPRKVKPL